MDHHLRITLAMPEHTDALLAFELDNRPHFEQWIASRGDAFYTAAAVRSSLEQAQWARNAQKEYHYLAWVNDAIVGRVTLRGAEREHYFKASLGYRFSAQHCGKGYATQAVSHVVEDAFRSLNLWRIEAVVIADNLPSQAVMRKCGFQQYGHSRQAVLRHGVWMDLLHYEKHQHSQMTAG